MQRRRITILTQALCASLIVHGLGVSALMWWWILHNAPPKLAALDRTKILLAQLAKQLPHQLPPSDPGVPRPKPPAAKKPLPPIKYDKTETPQHDDSGETNGKGNANRSTDGNQPMQANAGRMEQADLMKDADQFAADASTPASKGSLQGNDSPLQKAAQQGAVALDPTPSRKSDDPSVQAPAPDKPAPGVGPLPAVQQAVATPSPGEKEPQPKLPVAQVPTPKPEQKEIRGHKATRSDTESVAFARADSITFEAGKLEGRQGVKVKTTEPRYGDASYHDFEVIGDVPTVIGATVDVDGNVQDVQILQSSGSANVDQDRKLAVWNWVLEPKKDKDGHPILTWVINFG